MELPLIVLFYAAGLVATLCSAILVYISQDEIHSLIEKNYKKAQSLQYMQSEHDESINPFIILEIAFYLLASVLLGHYLITYNIETSLIFVIVAVVIFGIMLLRTIFFAVGAVSADSIASMFAGLTKLYFYAGFPFYKLFSAIHDKIRGKSTSDESREEISALVESAHEEG